MDARMSIAQKLSWEIVAMNDRGNASEAQRTALEICYGVSLAHDEKLPFLTTMNKITEHVSDPTLKHLLALYTARGVK